MILQTAITPIGAEGDGGVLCRRYRVCLGGEALFLAADVEAGAHGVDFQICHGNMRAAKAGQGP